MEEKNLERLLENQIEDKLKEETVNINGKQYISMELFTNLMREAMVTETLLGSLIHRMGDIEISDEEILMYISERFANTSIEYKDGKYTLVSK